MSIQEVHRLREERDEAQLALEQACRETFQPGMLVAYIYGRGETFGKVVGPDEQDDYLCIVRNPETGTTRTIKYESIIRIVD